MHIYIIITIFIDYKLTLEFCFSDTFEVFEVTDKGNILIPLTYKNIAWKSDREVKFKNPDGNLADKFKDFAKPPNWQRPIYELDNSSRDNNGFQNQDFIVWMRTAAFSTFRKLYRKVVRKGGFEDGLPAGDYQLDIKYSILSVCLLYEPYKLFFHRLKSI